MKERLREKSLLIGFGIFLCLTLAIGILGIVQIDSFTRTIKELGTQYLPREQVILEMKINNTLYAMGVRNYVLWHASKYLPAASLASNVDAVTQYSSRFKESLAKYESLSVTEKQKTWVADLHRLTDELERVGKELLFLSEKDQKSDKVSKLLVTFENKLYAIDDFLIEILSKDNLAGSQAQVALADKRKELSHTLLVLALCASTMLGILITMVVYRRLKEERLRRQMLVQRMIRIEEEERKNLSRQIHDQLNQDLSALKIYLGLVEKEPSSEEQREKLAKCKKLVATIIDKSHNISELLRPPALDEIGLIESIGSLVLEYEALGGLSYTYQKPQDEITLSTETSLALYRVAQEALTNVLKHADARNVTIKLEQRNDTVYFSVSDDGVGFNYADINQHLHRRQDDKWRLGLQGLRERIELLGGRLKVVSAPREGTTIQVELNM